MESSVDYFGIIVSVLGGLAFFLYGMSLLGSGLEKVSGGRLERTLEKMSNNIFKAVLFGALVTAAVQSSSATTVIVVGLVNANIIKLKQAIGVIMGANIGTTITAHILSMMDIQSDNFIINFLKPPPGLRWFPSSVSSCLWQVRKLLKRIWDKFCSDSVSCSSVCSR